MEPQVTMRLGPLIESAAPEILRNLAPVLSPNMGKPKLADNAAVTMMRLAIFAPRHVRANVVAFDP